MMVPTAEPPASHRRAKCKRYAMCFADDTSVYFSQNGFPFFPSSMMLFIHIYDLIYYSSVVKWLGVWGLVSGWFFFAFLAALRKRSAIGSLADVAYLLYWFSQC